MKNILLLLLVILLLGGAIFFLTKSPEENKTSITLEDREFIVDDPDKIEVITIEGKAYPLKHFSRQKNHWLFNNRQRVEPNVMSNMLRVLSKMHINYIPPNSYKKKMQNGFDRMGLTIKTFDKHGTVLSEFIMGGNTLAEDGTFCKRLGYDQVYVMSMPTTEGGLRAYFNQTQEQIRSKVVYDIEAKNISSVELNYNKDKQNSFNITRSNGSFNLDLPYDLVNKGENSNVKIVDAYIKNFDKLAAETIRTGHPLMDSIRNFVPYADLIIQMKDGENIELAFYPELDQVHPLYSTQKAEDVRKIERHFVFDNHGEVYVVQQRMLRDIFVTPKYFYR